MNFEEIIEDPSIEDIILSPSGMIYFQKGQWSGPLMTPLCSDKAQLWELSRKIAESASSSLGLTQPCVDALVPIGKSDNFRAHVVIPPMILEGPCITLRRLPKPQRYDVSSFFKNKETQKTLEESLIQGESILVAGPTGSGKTTLVTALLERIGFHCRFIILEDSPEIPLPNNLSCKLLARNNRFGFREGVSWALSDLVFESLRMRPERLILGECRGPEALALAHALLTGHRGMITTIHAGSVDEARERFIELASQQSEFSKEKLSTCWDNIVVVENLIDNHRRIKAFWNHKLGTLL